MEGCARCETLPDRLPEKGRLFFSPPIAPFAEDLKRCLGGMGLRCEESYPNIFEVQIDLNQLTMLCNDVLASAGALELEDTKCLLVDVGNTIDIRSLTQMVSLNSLLATINGAWLLNVLRSKTISVWFQPIVEIEDPTRIFAYECLCRGVSETGELVLPEKMFRTARDADLLFNLDRLCRLSAVRSASLHKIETNIFINFNPQAIYDPTYCLQTTCRAIDDLGMIPERIVFEVVESDRITDIEHLSGILNYYRNNGYRVAMDDVGAGYSSLNLLSKLKPDFIKIDKELIREVDIDDYKATITRAMIRLAKDLGIQVIAEGVERQSEWAWVKENAADFAQGNFFYRPADHPLGVGLQRGT